QYKKLGIPDWTIECRPEWTAHGGAQGRPAGFGDIMELRGGTPWRCKKTAIGPNHVARCGASPRSDGHWLDQQITGWQAGNNEQSSCDDRKRRGGASWFSTAVADGARC